MLLCAVPHNMLLRHLHVYNFKNYEDQYLEFAEGCHVLMGMNGSGKTNLLDAIYYLGFTKSAFAPADGQNVREGQHQFLVKGKFERPTGVAEVTCAFQKGKKSVRENDVEYTRLAEHIGKYPVVLICPRDGELVTGSSESRRRFFDSLLSQLFPDYLTELIRYHYYLKQRNALLQLSAQSGRVDYDLFAQYHQHLAASASVIIGYRQRLLPVFTQRLVQHYSFVCGGTGEQPDIGYEFSSPGPGLAELLQRAIPTDLVALRTTIGPHRDRFTFSLSGRDLRKFGSQGQQKSFVVALKLAEFQTLERPGDKPILLLDDIFDKLDDQRVKKLMELMKSDTFGQVFITDASPIRAGRIFEQAGILPRLYRVEQGRVTPA